MSDATWSNIAAAKRVVIKVGTNIVIRHDGRPAIARLAALVETIGDLKSRGADVLLVSSGSVGVGAGILGFTEVPKRVVDRQACAAAGQGALVSLYCRLMDQVGCRGAQVLLTEADFANRGRYLNLHQTLERLLELGVVPIINENDTVSTKELAYGNGDVFGDNDRLSALVASRVEADLLVLLTDVDGVFTAHPNAPGSVLVERYEVNSEVETSSTAGVGRGGMKAKIEAATVASRAGVTVVIANGSNENSLRDVCRGEPTGTLFEPRPILNSRKRWLAFATSPQGVIVVNDGARNALINSHASLLPKGVVSATGDFSVGDTISIASGDGIVFARGVTNFSCSQTLATKGRHTADLSGRGRERMVVHCENLVILEEVGT